MVAGRSRSQQLVLRDLEVSTAHASIGLGVGGAGLYAESVFVSSFHTISDHFAKPGSGQM
jgi:hypothetical protein